MQSISNALRSFAAFLIAPAVATLPWPFVLFGGVAVDLALFDPNYLFEAAYPLAGHYAYPLATFVGVPAYLLIRGFRRFTLGISVVIGIVITSLPSLAPLSLGFYWVPVVTAGLGAAAGAVFWLIAEYRVADDRVGRRSGRRLLFESVLLLVLVMPAVVTFGKTTTRRNIPSDITANAIEQLYGPLLDEVESILDILDPEERAIFVDDITSRLVEDPAVLKLELSRGTSVDQPFLYLRGDKRDYGCTGNNVPAQKGIMQCTLGDPIFGSSAIMYMRALPGEKTDQPAGRIMLDNGLLLERIRRP